MLPTDSSDQRSRFLFVSTDTLPYYTPPPNYPTPNHPSRRRDSRRDAAILDDDDQAQAQPLEDRVQDASSPQDQESYYPTSAALSATSRRHSTPVTSSPLARVHRPSQSLPSAILNPGHPNQAQTGKGGKQVSQFVSWRSSVLSKRNSHSCYFSSERTAESIHHSTDDDLRFPALSLAVGNWNSLFVAFQHSSPDSSSTPREYCYSTTCATVIRHVPTSFAYRHRAERCWTWCYGR